LTWIKIVLVCAVHDAICGNGYLALAAQAERRTV
jgi:hypothetical protein